jgi:phospholipase C
MRSRIIILSFLASLSWSQSIAGVTNVVITVANCGHTWTDAHADIDGGKMDGFAPFSSTVNDVNQACVQLWQSDIPQLWARAQSGVVADHHFEPIAGPSFTKQA